MLGTRTKPAPAKLSLAEIEKAFRERKVQITPGPAFGPIPAMKRGDVFPSFAPYLYLLPELAEANRLILVEGDVRRRIEFDDDFLLVDLRTLAGMIAVDEVNFYVPPEEIGKPVNREEIKQLARDGKLRVKADSRRIVLKEEKLKTSSLSAASAESMALGEGGGGPVLTWQKACYFVFCTCETTPGTPINLCCKKQTCEAFTCENLPLALKFKLTNRVDDAGDTCCPDADDLPMDIEFTVPRTACNDEAKTATYYLDDLGGSYGCMIDIEIALSCVDGSWFARINSTFPSDGGGLEISSTSPFAASTPDMRVCNPANFPTVQVDVYE